MARSIAFHKALSWPSMASSWRSSIGEPVLGGPVQIEKAELLGGLTCPPSDEEGIDLEREEGRQGISLGRRLARLVVGDHQATVGVPIDPVEDSSDHDAIEVLEHVELAVDRVERRRVLDAEVVGEQLHRLHSPLGALTRCPRRGLRTRRRLSARSRRHGTGHRAGPESGRRPGGRRGAGGRDGRWSPEPDRPRSVPGGGRSPGT